MKPSANITHPLFKDYRNGFFCYNRKRRLAGSPAVSFEEYVKVRGLYGPRQKRKEQPIPPRAKRSKVSRPDLTDPVYRVHAQKFMSFNARRVRNGLRPMGFEEYIDHLSTPAAQEEAVVEKKERPDLMAKWEAENARRDKRGLLPLKYDDFVRDWSDWV